MSRVSRIGLPLSNVSSTAKSRECFWTARASAYRWRARAWPGSAAHAGKAPRAAATAASTSAGPPWDTRASGRAVAGFTVSNSAPLPGAHFPPMNSPNSPPWRAIHCNACASLSGAGP